MPRRAPAAFTTGFALSLAMLLSGCLGGSIAQQVASSIATRVADNAVGNMVDEQLRKDREPRHIDIMNTEPDPYLGKFLTMQFPDPQQTQAIVEPLPAYVEVENGKSRISSSRLVPVEILNLIIGQEKQAVLERGMQNGSTILPAPAEWRRWQLAAGNLQGHADAQLYFLLPPDFGRVTSGDTAIVEIASVGGIHIARHRVE